MVYTEGFTEISPRDNAIYIQKGASAGDLINAFNSGKDVMIPAGETFNIGESGLWFNKGGESPDKPRVVGVYGEGDRPTIKTNDHTFNCQGYRVERQISNIIVQGIHVEGHKANYNSPEYDPDNAREYSAVYWACPGENITFEDCKFSYMKGGAVVINIVGEPVFLRSSAKLTSGITMPESVTSTLSKAKSNDKS